jgi:hypothetical protein
METTLSEIEMLELKSKLSLLFVVIKQRINFSAFNLEVKVILRQALPAEYQLLARYR